QVQDALHGTAVGRRSGYAERDRHRQARPGQSRTAAGRQVRQLKPDGPKATRTSRADGTITIPPKSERLGKAAEGNQDARCEIQRSQREGSPPVIRKAVP